MKNKIPILIISSARSGTKLLRDILASSNEFTYYPYDVNYIWKYKSYYKNHDELDETDFTEEKSIYIKNFFSKLGDYHDKTLLEKTVSNSLRLEYVKKVFPNVKIIHLYRDGREVTTSLKNCWMNPTFSSKNQSFKLIMQKSLNFPLKSAFPYLWTYLKSNLTLLSNRTTLSSWGPRFEGIDEMLLHQGLIAVCATQWALSTEKTINFLKKEENHNTHISIRYEDLLTNPQDTLLSANEFLKIQNIAHVCSYAQKIVSPSTKSAWETQLSEEEKNIALPILYDQLLNLNYI